MKFVLIIAVILLQLVGCEAPVMNKKINMMELTITQIHVSYINEDFNSEELVGAYLERIEQYNSEINAISIINPEAIAIAKSLDEEYQRTKILRPLHGIPMIVKDNINTKGLPTTAGSRALKDFIPNEDAFIIQKLVDAGAIIIAKSNMAEWAFSPMHTESSTHGTTRNPYNLEYVPAGSSGGTGAAIAMNLGAIGLGTDTGNSIRGPSSHNALVGFRATQGLISRSAIIPLFLRNDVAGPMTRTVEDATKVLEIMAGYDPADELTSYSDGKIPNNYTQFLDPNGLQGARIGVLRALSDANPDPEIKELFEQALIDMKSMGAEIVDSVEIPGLSSLTEDQWCIEFRKDLEQYLATYVKSDTLKTLEDIMRIGSNSEYTTRRLEMFADLSGRPNKTDVSCNDVYQDSINIAFRNAIQHVMDANHLDAIVYPTWNNIPARIENFSEEYRGDNSQIIAPHTGMPAFTIPMGFSIYNLPAGIQFLGRMYDEPTLIRLTYSYEQSTRHRIPPNF